MLSITEHDSEHLPIDKALILAMLQEAVDDYGEDWIDIRAKDPELNCRNVYEDDEGNKYNCIAGYVFAHNFDFIGEGWFIENNLVGQASNEVIWALEETTGRPVAEWFTFDAMLILEAAQRLQDTGLSWGSALQHVRDNLGLLQNQDERKPDFINAIQAIARDYAALATT